MSSEDSDDQIPQVQVQGRQKIEKDKVNWTQYELDEDLATTLVANGFTEPTPIQAQSLQYKEQHIDLVIAAKTGQGKTLCFALPIIDQLIRKIQKEQAKTDQLKDSELKTEDVLNKKINTPKFINSARALIISPTRELAVQISDMIKAVIPEQYQDQINTCCLVGGMSIQKQQRLLSYKPAIIVATPGRLWELMNERMEPYLNEGLPMIDCLVLDEADRMIADGHFKELHLILNHIYTQRVEMKKELQNKKHNKGQETSLKENQGLLVDKNILSMKDASNTKHFKVGVNLERSKSGAKIDASKIVDLNNEDFDDLMKEDIIIDLGVTNNDKNNKTDKSKKVDEQTDEQRDEAFNKAYMKLGGIQHIIASATLTTDNRGRITPRQQKMDKKKKGGKNGAKSAEDKQQDSALEALCKLLKFRSKMPKVIDLTAGIDDGNMPQSMNEYIVRCKVEEKDLYLYYYLMQKKGESIIIFCNAITATRRLNSLLDFLKIKNYPLHSKMQQKQRLKNLDRFKRAVLEIESGGDKENNGAILVCTDVAARGLDVPYVSNVMHYQCPFNAEVYVHRCGRTARMGRSGEACALLSPDDNKQFKSICQVLKKTEDDMKMFDIKYTILDKIKPLIDQAKELEKQIHRTRQDQKGADQMIQWAQDADLTISDELQYELAEKLGTKNAARQNLSESRLGEFKFDPSIQRKRDSKGEQKDKALKEKYEKEIQSQKMKKFSNSSFLTPEAALYLNEAINENRSKVDDEIIYAGLHGKKVDKMKFKRKEKMSARYKQARGDKRRKKGRFG